MTDFLTKILTNVLSALYQSFGFSLFAAVLIMFLCLYAKEKAYCANREGNQDDKQLIENDDFETNDMSQGLRIACTIWKENFLHNRAFRRLFVFAFYTVMILFRTLLNRNLWMNPISNVMGGWTLFDANGELSTEPIENLLLFIPFSFLLLWVIKCHGADRVFGGEIRQRFILWKSTKTAFILSLSIEFLQLFLRLGTFQLSDIFYNTLGGSIGGLLYWMCNKANQGKKNERDKKFE